MPKETKSNILKTQLIEALEKSLGIVSTACKKVGCSRKTFYKYYNEDKDFKNRVDDVSEYAKDFVESKMYKLIDEGNPATTIFYAKTKMRDRGYSERLEIESKNQNENINTDIDLTKLSTETLNQIKKELENKPE